MEWFNAVDLTYRSQLRELNDLNYGRFDTKFEQRVAEFRQEIAEFKSDLLKWMFIYWAGSTATTLGGIAAAVTILR